MEKLFVPKNVYLHAGGDRKFTNQIDENGYFYLRKNEVILTKEANNYWEAQKELNKAFHDANTSVRPSLFAKSSRTIDRVFVIAKRGTKKYQIIVNAGYEETNWSTIMTNMINEEKK